MVTQTRCRTVRPCRLANKLPALSRPFVSAGPQTHRAPADFSIGTSSPLFCRVMTPGPSLQPPTPFPAMKMFGIDVRSVSLHPPVPNPLCSSTPSVLTTFHRPPKTYRLCANTIPYMRLASMALLDSRYTSLKKNFKMPSFSHFSKLRLDAQSLNRFKTDRTSAWLSTF